LQLYGETISLSLFLHDVVLTIMLFRVMLEQNAFCVDAIRNFCQM